MNPMQTTPTEAARAATLAQSLPFLEFVMGVVLTGAVVLAVLLSGWLFPDGGEAWTWQRARRRRSRAWPGYPGHRPAGPRRAGARVVVGGQISLDGRLRVGAFGALLGTVMGLIAGYYRGFWDMIVMRFADVRWRCPSFWSPSPSFPSWAAGCST